MSLRSLIPVSAFTMSIALSSSALGAGFYIQEQSTTGLGRAFAGQAADAVDASTIFANPAGMVELDGPQMTVGGSFLIPSIDAKNEGSTLTLGGAVTNPVTGTSKDKYSMALVPNFYAAMPLSEDKRLWAGLGLSAPFGTVTEYEPTWFGRYDSIKSDLKVFDVAPSIAYKVNDWVSLGASLNIQYAQVELTSAIFTGGPDALSQVEGHSFAFGVNAGAQFKPWTGGTLGIDYRSQVTHHVDGRAHVTVGPVTLLDADAKAKLNLPDIVGVALAQNLTPDLKVMGQVNWFNWSRFNEIRVKTPTTTTVREQDYKDTFSVSAGAEYNLTEKWTLRGGAQWDETPTNDRRRSTRIPDQDRLWLALGASYNFNPNTSFDVGYAHIFYKDIDVDVSDTLSAGPPSVVSRTQGNFDNQANVISAALRYKF